MSNPFFSGMAKAKSLTQAGKLAEATALIQRLLGGDHGGSSAKPADAGSATIIDVEPVSVKTADAPPHSAGRARTEPRSGLGDTLRGLAARAMPHGLDLGLGKAARPPSEPLPDGASFTTASFSNAAGTRSYKLYVPANRRDGQPLPLVVMLHGCTQSPDDFAAGTRMNALAEEHGFLVAYPAQDSSANAQKCWNWFSHDHQRRDQGEPSLIAGMTRRIMKDHPVDERRVFIAGLSAGGAAAAILGASYPDLYAAVGVHSGLPVGAAHNLPSALAAMRQGAAAGTPRGGAPVPTIVFHGDRDSTVHPANGEAVARQSMAAAAGLTRREERGQAPGGQGWSRTLHADPSGRVLCEQWTIHGAGHAWAGGSPAGSYTDPRGPDATREMLRFFLETVERGAQGDKGGV
ncbi:extracellular catalytic domain type 1 short-chain-length polyhydroxyalkanoate depolymerase [Azospirillum rugosum]|uniref:Poly(Hydroxyalkanoate) depolymerase family esterase n=1 Tax=Azospirillum rugosum TaxID=416170 RepID=A0ABS4STB8_9PROT|nr:PHB depolymerase family esterase [Azospirillum rugosum]MBP2295474.1 poly(hydroxyalkanoate) depolymerase family esterase [Azospirillum rugosum]MDQ0528353.1 poly(hydroxyalkanoate) depolymerase family esterase [Azospirillum rugosum]